MGILHGCRAVVQMYQSLPQPVRSIEDAIIPCFDVPFFALPGDSAALVYDAQGKGKSMVWGGLIQEDPAGVAVDKVVYVTPMEAILESVGAKLAAWFRDDNLQITLLQ